LVQVKHGVSLIDGGKRLVDLGLGAGLSLDLVGKGVKRLVD
jgi:hypothetical protein